MNLAKNPANLAGKTHKICGDPAEDPAMVAE
jgi:hypothetical protein